MALTFNEIQAMTLKTYLPNLANQVLDSNAVIGRLRERNNMIVDGGESLVQPIKYAQNDTTKSFTGMDILNINPQKQYSAYAFDWKFYNIAIVYTDEEIAKNSGKAKVISLIDSKIKDAEMDLMSALNDDIINGDGTGNGGKDLTGLAAHVAADPTTGTIGGVDRATYTWARNNYFTSAGAWGSLTNQYGRADLDRAFTETRRGKDYADLVILSQTQHRTLKKEFQATELVNAQFKAIKGYGNVDLEYDGMSIIPDEMLAAGSGFVLNTRYLKFIISREYNFKMIPAIRPTNQASFVSHIRLACELVGSAPNRQTRINSIT